MSHLCDVRTTERPSLMMLRMQSHRKRRALGSIPVVGSSCRALNGWQMGTHWCSTVLSPPTHGMRYDSYHHVAFTHTHTATWVATQTVTHQRCCLWGIHDVQKGDTVLVDDADVTHIFISHLRLKWSWLSQLITRKTIDLEKTSYLALRLQPSTKTDAALDLPRVCIVIKTRRSKREEPTPVWGWCH